MATFSLSAFATRLKRDLLYLLREGRERGSLREPSQHCKCSSTDSNTLERTRAAYGTLLNLLQAWCMSFSPDRFTAPLPPGLGDRWTTYGGYGQYGVNCTGHFNSPSAHTLLVEVSGRCTLPHLPHLPLHSPASPHCHSHLLL